jgi:hypothetical protein
LQIGETRDAAAHGEGGLARHAQQLAGDDFSILSFGGGQGEFGPATGAGQELG